MLLVVHHNIIEAPANAINNENNLLFINLHYKADSSKFKYPIMSSFDDRKKSFEKNLQMIKNYSSNCQQKETNILALGLLKC